METVPQQAMLAWNDSNSDQSNGRKLLIARDRIDPDPRRKKSGEDGSLSPRTWVRDGRAQQGMMIRDLPKIANLPNVLCQSFDILNRIEFPAGQSFVMNQLGKGRIDRFDNRLSKPADKKPYRCWQ